MKKLLWLIVCLMTMVIGFTSCSSNDEKNPPIETSIIGTWENNTGEYICITFGEGNTYTIFTYIYSRSEDFSVKKSDFTISGNFIIRDDEIIWDNDYIYNATILCLTKTELVLHFNSPNDDVEILTFKRKFNK